MNVEQNKAPSDARTARATWAGVFLIVLASVASYSPLFFGGGWFSDDYMFVYGQYGDPLPTLGESVRTAGAGSYSVARTFSYALFGYGGWFLGEFGGMCLRIASHALNGVLLLLFILRMRFATTAALGAALIFATAPWHTQAVVWWICVHLGFAITFLLAALICYQQWLRSNRAPFLVGAQILVFASLSTYEQALASWLIFFGASLLQPASRDEIGRGRWSAGIRIALGISWWMLIPYALWAGLYLATYPLDSGVRTPGGGIERKLIAFASCHLRWFDSLWRLPWMDLLKQGVASLTLLAGGLVAIFAALSTRLLAKADIRRENESGEVSLPWALVFSYLLFAGFRWTFVVQGAISTETRHNYGADMGVALAVAAVAYAFLARRWHRPAVYAVAVTAFCLFNIVVTRGEAWHTARNVQDEKAVFEQARDALSRDRSAGSVVVVVRKPLTNGEKDFYEEKDGGWLEYRLEQALGRKITVDIRRDGSLPAAGSLMVELN